MCYLMYNSVSKAKAFSLIVGGLLLETPWTQNNYIFSWLMLKAKKHCDLYKKTPGWCSTWCSEMEKYRMGFSKLYKSSPADLNAGVLQPPLLSETGFLRTRPVASCSGTWCFKYFVFKSPEGQVMA